MVNVQILVSHQLKQTSLPGTLAAAFGWPDTAVGLRYVGTRVDPCQHGAWPVWGQSRSSHAPACTGFWFVHFWPGLYWSDSESLPAASDTWGHSRPRSTGSPVRGSRRYVEPKFLKPVLTNKSRGFINGNVASWPFPTWAPQLNISEHH